MIDPKKSRPKKEENWKNKGWVGISIAANILSLAPGVFLAIEGLKSSSFILILSAWAYFCLIWKIQMTELTLKQHKKL